MIETSKSDEAERDLAALVVAPVGVLRATEDPFEPYQLLDAAGEVIAPVAAFLAELQAAGRATLTQRSYGMALLRWFRFLAAVGVPWEQATRIEARDFSRWVQVAGKPARAHWRRSGETAAPVPVSSGRRPTPNPVTGKAAPGPTYAAKTAAHGETVLRSFYAFHLEAGSGPLVNPFPLARGRRGGRAHAHHNPMEPFRAERSGLYRPRTPERVPRQIPDAMFDEVFARLPSHRDRALVAMWVSTGARAAELLGVTVGDLDPGRSLVTVIRKGSRALQQLPASPDAFVWLRLYQAQITGLAPSGADQPVWWTLRRPLHPLTYHAAYRMFTRVNAQLSANWTIHDLRHTAAYRMARDPQMPLTDVQWILGHVHLSTTQIYLNPLPEDVIASVLAHHGRRASAPSAPPPTRSGYRAASLDVLFGTDR